MLRMFDVAWFVSAVVVLFVMSPLPAVAAIDCPDVGAEPASTWRHPTQTGLVAVLCRHDPLPGWWDSLWIVETAPGGASWTLEVPLHGTGVDRFSWLDCPGPVLARVVDRTHMGTLTDRVWRLDPDGQIYVVEATRLPPGSGAPRSRVPCP